uniref:Uncharacterized protein n=1 Tax=Populus trichocarpa TaxID=3694 RepID=A0A3N7EMQ7_POPTR
MRGLYKRSILSLCVWTKWVTDAGFHCTVYFHAISVIVS